MIFKYLNNKYLKMFRSEKNGKENKGKETKEINFDFCFLFVFLFMLLLLYIKSFEF
jgi:zona occludens toxin (predicted ATPase)